MTSPICLFTYNRYDETLQTVLALQANYMAEESDLYVFSDGPRDEKEKEKVKKVREYLKTVKGFKTVKKKILKFRSDLNEISEGCSEEKLYRFSVQFFPLTK